MPIDTDVVLVDRGVPALSAADLVALARTLTTTLNFAPAG
jgi:hypothetical protein